MKKSNNLVYLCYSGKEPASLMNMLNEFRSEYNYDIESHKIDEKCSPKSGFDRTLFIACGENENDFQKMMDEHNKNKDILPDRRSILCCPSEMCNKVMNKMNCHECISLNNMNQARNDWRKICDREFKGVLQGKEMPQVETTTTSTSQQFAQTK